MKINSPIVTLGPKGTDAEKVASKYSNNLILVESFPKAMEHAFNNKYIACICCGYQEIEGDHITNSWVNLHFQYFGKMEIIHTVHQKTKPMCVAIRKDCLSPNSIVLHPSTIKLLNIFQIRKDLVIKFVKNKPEAVLKVVDGSFDLCISSLDIVKRFPILEPLEVFQPQMVWAFYHCS